MKKRLMKISGIIVLLVMILSVTIYFYEINSIQFKINKIDITKIEDTTCLQFMWDDSLPGAKNEFMLSMDEAKDLASHPKEFRFINIVCDASNNSFFTLTDMNTSLRPSKTLSKIMAGKKISLEKSDEEYYNLDAFSSKDILITILVKAAGKTNQELIQAAKSSDYDITGYRDVSETKLKYYLQK